MDGRYWMLRGCFELMLPLFGSGLLPISNLWCTLYDAPTAALSSVLAMTIICTVIDRSLAFGSQLVMCKRSWFYLSAAVLHSHFNRRRNASWDGKETRLRAGVILYSWIIGVIMALMPLGSPLAIIAIMACILLFCSNQLLSAIETKSYSLLLFSGIQQWH